MLSRVRPSVTLVHDPSEMVEDRIMQFPAGWHMSWYDGKRTREHKYKLKKYRAQLQRVGHSELM